MICLIYIFSTLQLILIRKFQKHFEQRYITQFGTFPNKYAIRGFDLTMDILLRLI